MSTRRLASTQSKYVGPNQKSILQRSKTPYYRASIVISRGKKSGHNPWQLYHHNAMNAKRGALKRGKCTSKMDRWQNDEIYRASLLVHGWTDEWVKYLEYISKIVISHDAPQRQRLRYESTIFLRSVDSNKEKAGPLSQRPENKSSAHALVSLQRAQGKGVPHKPIHLRRRQTNTLDAAVQATFRMVEFQLADVFLIIFIFNMYRRLKVVVFFILGPSMARLALSRVARQRMVGSAITTTTPRSSNSTSIRRFVRKVRATRSQPLSNSLGSSLHS